MSLAPAVKLTERKMSSGADNQNDASELVGAIVEFCRFVRAHGLSSSTEEMIDSLEALRTVGTVDLEIFRLVLRTVLCSSKEDWDLFEALFVLFWENAVPRRRPRSESSSNRRFSLNTLGKENSSRVLSGDYARVKPEEGEAKTISGASAIERLRQIDFAQVSQTDLAELERLSHRLLRRLSFRISRKLRPKKSRGMVDLRKTIRLSLGRGGDPIELSYKKRRRQRAKLVILLDVSDSMNPYSLFLLKFAYVLKKTFREVTPFVFSTKLMEVDDVLRALRLSDALEMLSQMTTGWSGGTRIGGSLQDFNRLYASKLLSRETAFIILSDGWDTEAPEALVRELQKIKSRVRKLIWLNPLLGLKEYEPVTRAMSAALPYIDVFAPAHNLASLLELERHLMAA